MHVKTLTTAQLNDTVWYKKELMTLVRDYENGYILLKNVDNNCFLVKASYRRGEADRCGSSR